MKGRLYIPSPDYPGSPKLLLAPHATGKPFAHWAFHLNLLSVGVGSIQPLAWSPFACLMSSSLC